MGLLKICISQRMTISLNIDKGDYFSLWYSHDYYQRDYSLTLFCIKLSLECLRYKSDLTIHKKNWQRTLTNVGWVK